MLSISFQSELSGASDTGHRTPDGLSVRVPKGRTRTDGAGPSGDCVRSEDRTGNPFRIRIRDRLRRAGGQYVPAPTDRLSETEEERIAMAAFEAERAALAGVVEVVRW